MYRLSYCFPKLPITDTAHAAGYANQLRLLPSSPLTDIFVHIT